MLFGGRGGSLAYGALLEPPQNPALWHGRHPDFDPGSLEPYYQKVIADMGGVRLSRAHACRNPSGRSCRTARAAAGPRRSSRTWRC